MATVKERVDKHDREIAAIRKLLLGGAKMLERIEAKVNQLADKTNKLADSQLRTHQQLQDLIRNLNLG